VKRHGTNNEQEPHERVFWDVPTVMEDRGLGLQLGQRFGHRRLVDAGREVVDLFPGLTTRMPYRQLGFKRA